MVAYHLKIMDKSRPLVNDLEDFPYSWAEPWLHIYKNGIETYGGRKNWNSDCSENDSVQRFLVNPDRVDKPIGAMVKTKYSSIEIQLEKSNKKLKFRVRNQYDFLRLKDLTIR